MSCVICGGEIPACQNRATRKTCSESCRGRLNAMRWQANRIAAAEKRREEREAAGPRICAECGGPIPWERDLHSNTCSDACRDDRTRRKMQERERRGRHDRQAARVAQPAKTVRVKVTDLRTGETRWEDRPLVPYTGSAAQHEARRRGAAAAHAAQRGAAPWDLEVEDE